MKLEMQQIEGIEIPTIIVECLKCGSAISVRERDFMLSRPLQCRGCNDTRSLSYREFVITLDSLAPLLLAHSAARFDKSGCCHRQH